jgi:hypothetical protein
MDPVAKLHWHLLRAMVRALDGPNFKSTSVSLARRVWRLKAIREHRKFSAQTKRWFMEYEEPRIKTALLEAAENGTLGEVAIAQKRLRTTPDTGQLNVINAYTAVLNREERAPLVSELKKQLETELPRNQVPVRRTIEDILRRLILPTTPGKRGPREPERQRR